MFTTTALKTTNSLSKAFILWKNSEQKNLQEIGDFLSLGRDPANQVNINDIYTSARHARIEKKADAFFIKDLRSRNGTYVNGVKVQEAELKDNDHILVGKSEFLFVSESTLENSKGTLNSKNTLWNEQLSKIPAVAQSDLGVLLLGPSGSGKEVLAKLIHEQSSRRMAPMVCVNCSALSESLVESELFGHLKGSFTGATVDRKGAFEAARGGTLFLDEIGDLPLSLQPKLLRALENRQIRPVGSDRDIDTNVRIIAATHHDLRARVREEKFRADLYFRLNVVQIHTPALKDRMEDFDTLFYYFAKANKVCFSFAAIEKLKEHSWPGNIRELRNTVQRAKALFGQQELQPEQIPLLIEKAAENQRGPYISKSFIKEIEHEMIVSRLRANQGNQRQTASELGIPKSTLHDRIKSYGIDVKQFKA